MIELQDIHKAFGPKRVLAGMSLTIPDGQTTVLIGFSGTGKSVALKHIVGLLVPDQGRVVVDGEVVADLGRKQLATLRGKIGYVFQFAALFDSMSVGENVAFPLREHLRLPQKELKRRVMDKIEVLGLVGAEHRMPSEISGGMRKRVAVARGLILEPEILIYDEPTAGLDPIASRNVDDLINETAERFRGTSVVITHDMNTCFGVGHHVALLHEGRIHATGLPVAFAASADPVVRRFLAASGVTPVVTHKQG